MLANGLDIMMRAVGTRRPVDHDARRTATTFEALVIVQLRPEGFERSVAERQPGRERVADRRDFGGHDRHRNSDADHRRLRHTDSVGYADDPEGYKQAVSAKLQPENIRFTLMFASLLQMIHERLKLVVLEEVQEFYSFGCDDAGRGIVNEDAYRRDVLDLAPKNKFQASLASWCTRRSTTRRKSIWMRFSRST
ncbi:hypothetical protein ACFYUD_04270 [Nocardia tengchongensis]|uniref:hypothetical protein n=1 Tax=Nocardia tengchongensis TaxID=2055889 RepID=UPI0036902CFC